MVQHIIVTIILIACVAYTARRLWKRFHTPTTDSRCAGCPLSDTCDHKPKATPSSPTSASPSCCN